jgi:hypothetical protein
VSRDGDQGSWKVVLKLPDRGTFFVSLRATWGIPIDPAAPEETELSTLDAGRLFTVNND